MFEGIGLQGVSLVFLSSVALGGGWRRCGLLRPDCRRTYPVMAVHRRMLNAIAAIVTWAVALASPT